MENKDALPKKYEVVWKVHGQVVSKQAKDAYDDALDKEARSMARRIDAEILGNVISEAMNGR